MKFKCKIIDFLSLSLAFIFLNANASAPYVNSNALNKINASFLNVCHSNQFSGAVLVAINGKIYFEKACGLASKEFVVSNNINTRFNLGSVGKIFTAISIAQLIEAKKLSFHTHVVELIPSWLPMTHGDLITIDQLLIHASGLGNFMNDKRWQLGADAGLYSKTDNYQPLIAEEKLLFKPGTNQAYSNSGYLLLGKIIEQQSQESYAQYIQQHIFNVAKMNNTGIYPLDEIVKNRAVGYFYSCRQNKCIWKNNYFAAPFIGTAAGGAYTTVEDLFKFSQALYHGKLLNATLTRAILSTTIIQPAKNIHIKYLMIDDKRIPENFSDYGFAGAWNHLGLAVWTHPDLIGHTGGTTGASALFAISPDNQYTIIILSNISNGTLSLYQKIRTAFGFNSSVNNF